MAVYGDETSPMLAGPIIISAPSRTPQMRDHTSVTPKVFIGNGATKPPNTPPKSAARNGSQAKRAICFKSMCRSVAR